MDPIWRMGCQLWNYRFQTLWTPTPPSSQENALAELAISKKKQVRKKASPVLWQRRSSTEPTFVLEKKENVTTFECFFLSIDCIQPFFWPEPVAFRRVYGTWDLLVYHVTIAAPYPGGIDPRLAVYARSWDGHYTTTRRDRLQSIASNLIFADSSQQEETLENFYEKSSDSSAAKFRGSGGFGAEKNEKRFERKKRI